MGRKALLLLFVPVLGVVLTAQASAGGLQTQLVLTPIANGTDPVSPLLCRGRIHGYLTFAEPQTAGRHRLKAAWRRPDGRIEQQTEATLEFERPRQTAYVWLDLKGVPSRKIVGDLDPQGDLERAKFAGRWNVSVEWDGKPLLDQRFEMRCEN
jgi:hypothetical protein